MVGGMSTTTRREAGPRAHLARLLKPHIGTLVPALGLAVLVAVGRGLIVPAAAAVFEALDRAAHAGLGQATALLGAGVVVQAAARGLRTWATRRASVAVERDLRRELFAALLTADPTALQVLGRGESLSRLSHDTARVRQAVGALVTWVQNPITILAVAGATIHAASGAIPVALAAALGIWGGSRYVGRWTRSVARRSLSDLAEVEAHARDRIEAARAIQAAGAESGTLAEHDARSSRWAGSATALAHAQAVGPPLTETMLALALLAVLYAGWREGGSASDVAAFLSGLALLAEPVRGLAGAQGLWEEARAGLERVEEACRRARPTPDPPGARDIGPLERIDLRDISVCYAWGAVFTDLNLLLTPGDRVWVEGASGSGKTSLLDLLAGFADHDAGLLLWNGEPTSRWTRASRRAATAWVGQRPFILSGSLADNLRLASPGASDADLVDLCSRLRLGALLGRPTGLHAPIGDGGTPVSGGEAQRIALGRAVLRRAGLWLLDEPTAHIDPTADGPLIELVGTLAGEAIVVVASHRPPAAGWPTVRIRLGEGKARVERMSGRSEDTR